MLGSRQGWVARIVATAGWSLVGLGAAGLAGACSADAKRAGLSQRELPTGLSLDDTRAHDTADEVIGPDGADGADGHDGAGDGDTQVSEVEPGSLGDGEGCLASADCQSGFCLPTRQGRVCAARCDQVACALGRECKTLPDAEGLGVAVCTDRFASLCMPCRTHDDCALNGDDTSRCRAGADSTQGRFCAVDCGQGLPPCPGGYACDHAQCIPAEGGDCGCTPLAVSLEATTDCARTGDDGAVCDGVRRCMTPNVAPTACDAVTPGVERCNGLDDDCDGATDEAPLAPSCGDYACGGEAGCKTRCDVPEDCAPGLGCEGHRCVATGADGSPCDSAEACDGHFCSNGHCCAKPTGEVNHWCCAEDADCAALSGPGECTATDAGGCAGTRLVGRCDHAICVTDTVSDPSVCAGQTCQDATCEDGLLGPTYHGAHICSPSGECTPTANTVCAEGNPCFEDSCDVEAACIHAPFTGSTGGSCYTFDPATRGVGGCYDGEGYCGPDGSLACADEQGPTFEQCDGEDNDCDSATDEDGTTECYPYLCGGADGCGWFCNDSTECAPGAYCDDFGECASTGDAGSYCDSDLACKSGYCDNGACCEGGTCCHDDTDCWMYDDVVCDTGTTCTGHSETGFCRTDYTCDVAIAPAPDACWGEMCGAGPTCDGASVIETPTCDADGACGVVVETTPCAPYTCRNGACLGGCNSNADCAPGGKCSADGTCLLANGSACEQGSDCAGGRCNNGFCCSSGTCCGADADCAALGNDGTCDEPSNCRGTQVVATCGQASSCVTQTIETSAPCVDVACKQPECTNLTGGNFVKEGVKRALCDAAGDCRDVTRDCRDLNNVAFCGSATTYPLCSNCSDARATCIVLGLQCYCE